MKIVVAPNALKDCLTAVQAAAALACGVARVDPSFEVVQVPVADGGDGLTEVLIRALHGVIRTAVVSGPLGDPVVASFCHVPERRLAVIEMARASGLALVPKERRNPLCTTTLGVGELIRAALDLGSAQLVIGIGGSATHDGGIGMATALGGRFLDARGQPVPPVGGALNRICHIDLSRLDPRLAAGPPSDPLGEDTKRGEAAGHFPGRAGLRIEVICDVDNPLLGERGAAQIYSPQKGALPEQIPLLEEGLANLANIIERDLGIDVRDLAGAGAAGGLGAGLVAFLGAELRRGIDVVLDLVGLDLHLTDADLVLTAEGQMDFQTAFGKAPAGVAERAHARGVPCIAIVGRIGSGLTLLHERGIHAVFSLCPGPLALEEAIARGGVYLAAAAEQAVRAFLAGYQSARRRQ